jgi:DNA-binding transcriptional LysR family regulator
MIVLNGRMIDPRLQTLRVLRSHGTVTATADVLHVSPSTVSQQLRQLARELRVDLLEAEGRRVRLTPAALTLLDHADELYARTERIQADLAAHQDWTAGRLRMCGISTALAALLTPAAAAIRQTHPRLDVELTEAEADESYDLLLTGRTDISVVLPTPDSPSSDDARFEQQPLLDEPQDLLVPGDHPFVGRADVVLEDAAAEPWIGSRDRGCEALLMVACAAAGFSPRIAHLGKDWTAVSALVAYGFGITLVPRLAYIPPDDSVVRVPLAGDTAPSRRLLSCTRRGSGEQPHIVLGLTALQAVVDKRGGAITP